MRGSRDAVPVVLLLVSAFVGQQLFLPQLGSTIRGWLVRTSESTSSAPRPSTALPPTRCSVPFIATSITSGFGVVAEYDSRDNEFYPQRGTFANVNTRP